MINQNRFVFIFRQGWTDAVGPTSFLMEGGAHRFNRVGPQVLGYWTAGAELQLQTVGEFSPHHFHSFFFRLLLEQIPEIVDNS